MVMPKSRNKRRIRSSSPECQLCKRESQTLKIHNACLCVSTDQDFEIVETVLNGEVFRSRVLKKSEIPSLRLRYIEKLGTDKAVIIQEAVVDKSYRAKNRLNGKTREEKNVFYQSWEWKEARYKILNKYGPRCMLCGANNNESRICVDHIVPISRDWTKRLKLENLQVLCNDCNMGKSNRDTRDFRGPQPN